MKCQKKELMNYNNFEELYINSDFSNIEQNRVKGRIIGTNNKHIYITAGLKYDVEYSKIKEPIILVDEDIFFIEKNTYGKYIIIPKCNNTYISSKVVGYSFNKQFTNGFFLSYTKYIQNVLVGTSEGLFGLVLKRRNDKGLVISLKKREPFYLIRCKYLTSYNRWLLLIDKESYLFKIIKPIVTRKILTFLEFKILRNIDKN